MKGFITGIVLGLMFMIPFALIAGTFEKDQGVIVCFHEGTMNIVATADECPGQSHQGKILEATPEHVDVQVDEEVFRIFMIQ